MTAAKTGSEIKVLAIAELKNESWFRTGRYFKDQVEIFENDSKRRPHAGLDVDDREDELVFFIDVPLRVRLYFKPVSTLLEVEFTGEIRISDMKGITVGGAYVDFKSTSAAATQ